jgi:TPR repeat protein
MRRFVFCLMFVSVTAGAADLSEANRLLAAKEYGKALPLYTQAARSGDAQAQFRLGEMYWYGDGTAQDLDAAIEWMGKAAAAGNPDAKECLAILERRKLRGAEIDYWMTQYRGEELHSGKFACPAPAFPPVSKTNGEIAATEAGFTSWQACYNGFVDNFSASMPVGKVISQEVLDMMSPAEFERVRAHIEPLYRKIMTDGQAQAAAVLAQRDAWEKSTRAFVIEANRRRKQQELENARIAAETMIRLPGATDNRALSGK